MTDSELAELLPPISKRTMFNYNDIINEIERRRLKREAAKGFWLSLAAVIMAGLSLLASVLLALFK